MWRWLITSLVDSVNIFAWYKSPFCCNSRLEGLWRGMPGTGLYYSVYFQSYAEQYPCCSLSICTVSVCSSRHSSFALQYCLQYPQFLDRWYGDMHERIHVTYWVQTYSSGENNTSSSRWLSNLNFFVGFVERIHKAGTWQFSKRCLEILFYFSFSSRTNVGFTFTILSIPTMWQIQYNRECNVLICIKELDETLCVSTSTHKYLSLIHISEPTRPY